MRNSTKFLTTGIMILFAIMLGTTIHFQTRVSKLENHNKIDSPKYSYAYDCIMEAELKYWELKADVTAEMQHYIDSVTPYSNLRAYAIIEECERYNVDPIFVLTQGEIESHFGTKGLGSKLNNVFNIGVFDGATAETVKKKYQFVYPNESIEPYLELLFERYLVNKTEQDLMNKYVDINGKRYASNPDYENIFKSKYKYICDNTNLETKISAMKSYAIKCNR